jgi:hypothetical protein
MTKKRVLRLFPTTAFHPQAMTMFYALAGFLAYSCSFESPILRPSHSAAAEQWQGLVKSSKEFTVAGTAPDFNRIPF